MDHLVSVPWGTQGAGAKDTRFVKSTPMGGPDVGIPGRQRLLLPSVSGEVCECVEREWLPLRGGARVYTTGLDPANGRKRGVSPVAVSLHPGPCC